MLIQHFIVAQDALLKHDKSMLPRRAKLHEERMSALLEYTCLHGDYLWLQSAAIHVKDTI